MDGPRPGAKRGLDEHVPTEVALRGRARSRRGTPRRRRARARAPGRPPSRRRRSRGRARAGCERSGSRSRHGSRRAPSRTLSRNRRTRRAYSPARVTLPDQLTLARALAVPVVVVLFAWDFPQPRLLGDRGLRRRDGDRSGRRLARAPEEPDVRVRLAPRSDRGQGARPRDARDARRRGHRARLDGRGDRRARDRGLRPAPRGARARAS